MMIVNAVELHAGRRGGAKKCGKREEEEEIEKAERKKRKIKRDREDEIVVGKEKTRDKKMRSANTSEGS